tara:strand:- start:16 stop:249 length:234 start_codon:yes stop_codon:yes gene_type:complete
MQKTNQFKALIVTGTRPEIIKMAPVYYSLLEKNVEVLWCHTGQHTSLADQTFNTFDVVPDFNLTRPSGKALFPKSGN